MADYVKKSFQLFFAANDENQFEADARKLIPTFCIIDGSVWPTTQPNVKHSFAECESPIVYLWDPKVCRDLPFQSLGDGQARGPTSGVVIQYRRSKNDGEVLTSGDMGIGYKKNDLAMAQFVKSIWKIAKAMNSGMLCSIHKNTRKIIEKHIDMYVVGTQAAQLSKDGILLKHCASEFYYRIE